MRHGRDPRRHNRHEIELLEPSSTIVRDANGDPIAKASYTVVYRTRAAIQPWLPRYNIPAAPVLGGVSERRIAARVYLPKDAPVHLEGLKVRDVTDNVTYSLVTDGLNMAGGGNMWRCDLGAARVSS